MKSRLQKLTLGQRYMLTSAVVMLAGMIIIGAWVARLIEQGVASRTAAITAIYVDSYVAPYLQELTEQDSLSERNVAFFERLLSENSLGREIRSFKVWTPDGTIVYSQDSSQIGQQFPIEAGLETALAGIVYSELSGLDRTEHEIEREFASELMETYAPVRANDSDQVIAVSEFYQSADELRADIRAAQVRSWLAVALVMSGVYLLLAGIVQRASNTIERQQSALHESVSQLNALLIQNSELHERSRRAAARTTDLNERYLRRISSDLHDGPAQDLALALLHMESLASATGETTNRRKDQQDATTVVRGSVETALQELRNISAGLRLPHIRNATLEETVQRAVRDYEQKSACNVDVSIGDVPEQAPVSTKIALYRLIQEALGNGYRHAQGKQQALRMNVDKQRLIVEIEDGGPGFDPASVNTDTHLGLISMSERVEMLGGAFSIHSRPGEGTVIRATMPLTNTGDDYE